MATYTFFGGKPSGSFTADFSPNTTLSDVRNTLTAANQMSADYEFVYLNQMTSLKTIFTPQTSESQATIDLAAFFDTTGAKTKVLLANVSTAAPSLFGMKQDWLNNGHLGVQCILNLNDSTAQAANAGFFQPLMLSGVKAANPNSSADFFDNVVVCQKGTLLQFNISAWGAAGFGYSITTESGTNVCDGLYICYPDNGMNTKGFTGLWRYAGSNNTIKIESNAALGIASQQNIQYSKMTIKAWSLTSYNDGSDHSSSQLPPVIGAQDGGGFQPGPPSGDTVVPAGDVQPGATSAGPTSNQTIGGINSVTPAGVPAQLVGVITLYIFVFVSKEAANEVINIVNSPDLSAFGQ